MVTFEWPGPIKKVNWGELIILFVQKKATAGQRIIPFGMPLPMQRVYFFNA